MRIVIEIDCQNEAFTDGESERVTLASAKNEIRRILGSVDLRLKRDHALPFTLQDINGNTVGNVRRLKSRNK